jgi:predicted ATPase
MRAPLFGRDADLGRVQEAFSRGAIVTLLGPPGVGKTRLAMRIVDDEIARGQNARFCDVTAARTEAALLHAIATVSPARPQTPGFGSNELGAALAAFGPLLLVLDNFEQVVHAAPIVAELVAAAPELRVVVTSRERLAVGGEISIELGPLAPGDASALFRERALAAGGELSVNDERAIAELVAKLDGIPLALELAAARTRMMTPGELLARADERFALLRRTRGDAGKHAALETAIDGSWDLLTEPERHALAELSVFAGSFDVTAACAILSPSLDVLAELAALRDKSLVHAAAPGRLALFVSIREYAAARLDERPSADREALRRRHARHYAEAARALNVSRLFQGQTPDSELRRRLLEDRDDLLAALAFAREQHDAWGDHAELACAVTHLFLAPGTECIAELDAALAAIEAAGDDRRLRVLLVRQGLSSSLGRFEESRRDLDAVLSSPELAPPLRALALNTRGIQERFQARYRASWETHREAERLLAGLDLPRLAAINTACMGRLQCDFGDERLGREYNERARAICVDIGDRWLEALVLGNLGQLEQEHGNFDLARDLLERAVARFREASEPLYLGVYLGVLGDLCFEAEAIDAARRAYEEAATFFSRWRAHRQAAALFAAWGALEAQHSERAAAEAHFAQARRTAERCDSPTVRLFLELHEASLRLRRAHDAASPEGLAHERTRWNTRRAALVGRGEGADDAERETVACSIDVRFALRMLAQAIARTGDEASPNALVVGEGAAWFQLRGAPKVDLVRRGPLRRLLDHLVVAHANARGEAVAPASLVEAAWPGEKLLAEAAATRLRVAVATLRKMGLKELLRTGTGGYFLAPDATVERG